MAKKNTHKKDKQKNDLAAERSKDSLKLLNRLIFLFFGIFIVLITTFKISGDDDIFWHLETGKYIVENKSIPSSDIFGFVTQGQPWVPFEWGWDAISYLIYSFSGYAGISIFRTLIFISVFYFFFRLTVKLDLSTWVSAAIFILLVFGMFDRLIPKPQIISYLFTSILLYILISVQTFNRQNIKIVYFLPFIFLLWCNMHMGVIAGAGILTIYLISETVIYLRANVTQLTPLSKQDLIKLTAVYFGCLIALLINPHGFYTYQYVYTHLNMKMLEDVFEWYSPFNKVFSGSLYQYLYFLFLGFAGTSIYYSYKTKNIFTGLLIIVFTLFSFSSARYTMDFMLITTVIAVISISGLLKQDSKSMKPAIYAVMGIIIVLIVLLPGNNLYTYMKYERTSGFGVDTRYYPSGLFDFIRKNNIDKATQRPFNSFNIGGYLIWETDGLKNFIDSRNLADDIYYNYKTINNKLPGFEQRFEQDNFDCIIWFYPFLVNNSIELKTSILSYLINNSDKWKLIYWDDSSFLFVKNEDKFKELINKYEYRFVNPYYYIYEREPLKKALAENSQEVISEIQRKYKDEPDGNFINTMVKTFKVPVSR